jgi:hypothetical protein
MTRYHLEDVGARIREAIEPRPKATASGPARVATNPEE